MPVYEHRCRACGTTFDDLRRFADADAVVACTCGSTDTVRLMSTIMRPITGEAMPMASGGGCCGGGCACAG